MKKITSSLLLIFLIFLFLLFITIYFIQSKNNFSSYEIMRYFQLTFFLSSISLLSVMFSKTPGAFETSKGQIIAVGIPSNTRKCIAFSMGIIFGVICYILLLFLSNIASFQPSSTVSMILISLIYYFAYKVSKLSVYGGEVLSFLIKSPPPLSLDKETGAINELQQSKSDLNKPHSVFISSNGEIIRKTTNSIESSDSNINQTKKGNASIMWDFKLRKTRIILVLSIIYTILFNWLGVEEDVLDELWYWSWMSPIFIYWIVVPSYRWIMKGK